MGIQGQGGQQCNGQGCHAGQVQGEAQVSGGGSGQATA